MAESAYKALKEERDWTVTLVGQYQPDDEVILRSSVDSNLALMAAATKVEYKAPEIDWDKLGMFGYMQSQAAAQRRTTEQRRQSGAQLQLQIW